MKRRIKEEQPDDKESISGIVIAVLVILLVLAIGQNPVPPGPNPGPTPDVVTPVVTGKIRVLIVYDALDRSIPTDKRLAYGNVLNSVDVRKYLADKCVIESTGSPAFRIAGPNADFSRDDQFWKSAIAVKHDGISVPYIVIYRDDKGYVSPLPDTVQAMLDLLRKYGGA
jgi:hypothetical protein